MPVLCQVYGTAAAALACEFYELQCKEHSPGSTFTARVAAVVPDEQIQASVRYAAGFLFKGQPESTRVILANQLYSNVFQAANQTIAENAVRESDETDE